ncbi:MAG: UDP-N-acetylmuramoyl-L-alanyl-D-glutamate--2,6-diaminopimelate ligase, partial [Chloroflexi bacterium]
MKLEDLLSALPDYSLLAPAGTPVEVSAITADSRRVQPGALFVAYRGVSVDGHRFIPQAIERGAAAIVLEEPQIPAPVPLIRVPNGREALAHLSAAWYGFPARKMTMVGITGTDGKTTTTNFLFHILQAAGRQVGMISTVNAVIGHQVLDTGLHTTTPDAPDVQRYLAQMVQAGTDTCLLEVTSHGLTHHRVTGCDFDVAIVTNITHEHLDLHGSLEAYRAAKARLFESLATAANKGRRKAAVLNCDDSSFDYLRARLEPLGIPWIGYSLTGHPQATITARGVVCQPDRTRFTLHGPGYTFPLETVLVGDYNVSNCLAAATAALELLDVPPEAVQAGVSALPGVPGRMERVDEGQPFLALVDFAHTPNSLERALTAARSLAPGRVIAVFGCAGLRDVQKRAMMGRIAARLADCTIITAEDPRTEDLAAIIDETARAMLAAGAVEGRTFERIPDRGRAIFRAVQLARPGDVVLALGKGHEQSMCFGETEYPWDDREALRAALRGHP